MRQEIQNISHNHDMLFNDFIILCSEHGFTVRKYPYRRESVISIGGPLLHLVVMGDH
jgi:hypothetical protein